MTLQNKVAVITGAGRGLGQATAIELIQAGAIVYVTDIDQETSEKSAEEIKKSLGLENVFALACDVRNENQAQEVIEKIVNDQGRIDILVNNAGVNVTATVETLPMEEWDRIVSTNLRGQYLMAHEVFPIMKKQKSGSIINISSSLAKRVKENSPAYVASKWGVLGLSQLLCIQGKEFGIKVTAFSPSGMNTRLLLDRFPDIDQSKLMNPAEAAKVIRFILELSDNVTIPDIFMMSTNDVTWP